MPEVTQPTEIETGAEAFDGDYVGRCQREFAEVQRVIESGKRALVVGSGRNTRKYAQIGADTLDIDQRWNPKYLGDACHLSRIIGGQRYNLVYAEGLPLKHGGYFLNAGGVFLEDLAQEAKKILARGGTLLIGSITVGEIDIQAGGSISQPTPKPDVATTILLQAGYKRVCVDLGPDRMITSSPLLTGDKGLAKIAYNERMVTYRARV